MRLVKGECDTAVGPIHDSCKTRRPDSCVSCFAGLGTFAARGERFRNSDEPMEFIQLAESGERARLAATIATIESHGLTMELELFLNRLDTRPETIEFPDVIALVNSLYTYIPTAFRNHDIYNEAGQNTGSCKVFAFARLHELSKEQTLALFGAYYRSDVLRTPDGDSHPNIRQFMKTGWAGIEFEGVPLRAKG